MAVTDPRLRRELCAFVHYCIARISRELDVDGWELTLSMAAEAAVEVRARLHGTTVAARSASRDPVLAFWEAFCQIEQPLREANPRELGVAAG